MNEEIDDWDDETLGDGDDLFATDEELAEQYWETLPAMARMVIYAATCRAGNGDEFPHIRVDMMSSVSRIAVHYGLGGDDHFHQLTRRTIGIRSGLQLVHQGVQIGALKAGDVITSTVPRPSGSLPPQS